MIARLGAFDVYDLGGGLGVQYRRGEPAPDLDRYLDAVTGAASRFLPDAARIVLEPGRSLVARSTTTVYRIVTVKRGEPTFVAVDGGIADNFEASVYMGHRFDATLVGRVGGGDPVELVGRHCESGDRLATQVPLHDPRPGDLVAMPMTGAYTHTLVNHYNGALRPAVVFCRAGVAARWCGAKPMTTCSPVSFPGPSPPRGRPSRCPCSTRRRVDGRARCSWGAIACGLPHPTQARDTSTRSGYGQASRRA